jgi:hypothetical protein
LSVRGRLALLLAALYGSFYASLGHNETAHLDLVRALAEDQSPVVDRFRYNSADLIVHGERTYSNKAPGTALAALPAFALAERLTRGLPLSEPSRWDLVAYFTTLGSIGLASILAALATFRLVARRIADERAALAAVLALWCATPLFPFSTMLFGHALAAALVAFASARWLDADRQPSAELAGGAALGLGIATEYPVAVLALPLLALGGPRPPRLVLRLAGIGLGLVPLLAYQHALFGDALFPTYQAYVAEGRGANFPGHAQGLLGVHWPGLRGFTDNLVAISVGPARGLLRLCPVLGLALPGLWWTARSHGKSVALGLSAAVLSLVALNACYGDSIVYWGGGASLGPRHLLPALPLLALPLAEAARRVPRLMLLLALPSALAMLAGAAVDARVPYEAADAQRDFLHPRYARGEFALREAVLFTPGTPGHAENLGSLLGLPGPWQLMPLGLCVLGLGRSVAVAAGLARAPRVAMAAAVAAAVLYPALRALAVPPGAVLGSYASTEPGARTRLRADAAIDFDWRRDAPVLGPLDAAFSGALEIEPAGTYRFRLAGQGRHEVFLDGQELVSAAGTRGEERELSAGVHALVVRTFGAAPDAGLQLLWTPPAGIEVPVPASRFVRRGEVRLKVAAP